MKYHEGLEMLIRNMEMIRKNVAVRIDGLPEGEVRIYQQKKNGKTYVYYKRIMNNGSGFFITKDQNVLRALSLKTFLTINLSLIDQYIMSLQEAVRSAEKISVQEILRQMPERLCDFLSFDSGEESIATQSAVQKKRKAEFLNAEYPAFILSDTQIKHVTSDGTIVRSKSELIIYELLLQYHITFRYEKPIIIGGMEYRPDFTILLPDGKVIYWEHAGMMTKEEYRERHKKKMDAFESAGIVPWDNLIVTYDDRYGNININLIISEIENKLLA